MSIEKDDFNTPIKTNREYLSETYNMARDTNETVKTLADTVYGNPQKAIKGMVNEISELKKWKQQVKDGLRYFAGAVGIGSLAAYGKKAFIIIGEFFKVASPIILAYFDFFIYIIIIMYVTNIFSLWNN